MGGGEPLLILTAVKSLPTDGKQVRQTAAIVTQLTVRANAASTGVLRHRRDISA